MNTKLTSWIFVAVFVIATLSFATDAYDTWAAIEIARIQNGCTVWP